MLMKISSCKENCDTYVRNIFKIILSAILLHIKFQMKLALSEVEGYIEYSIYMQTTSSVPLKKWEILSTVLINKHREIIPNCCFPSVGKRFIL